MPALFHFQENNLSLQDIWCTQQDSNLRLLIRSQDIRAGTDRGAKTDTSALRMKTCGPEIHF